MELGMIGLDVMIAAAIKGEASRLCRSDSLGWYRYVVSLHYNIAL